MGCGFHYDKITTLSNCIKTLAFPFQPCMNHVEKAWEEYTTTQIFLEVIVKDLCKSVAKAEKSARELKPKYYGEQHATS